MSVIVQQALYRYAAPMAAAVTRLLALIALIIMPFGMATTAAMAGPTHHATAMAGSGHCDDQQQDQAPVSKPMDCAAACAALASPAVPLFEAPAKPKAPRTITAAAPFNGIILEIATPPPRLG
jgi:hypothetical protein